MEQNHSTTRCVPRSRRRRIHRFTGDAGTALVEAAFVTPLLLLLTFAIIDFGALCYVYLALENGVSQAVRYGVTGQVMNDPNNGQPLSRESTIKLVMRQSTPTLTIDDAAFTFSHMAPGAAGWAGGVGGPGEIDKVTVNYNWNILTPLMRPLFAGGQVHFKVDAAMKNEPKFN